MKNIRGTLYYNRNETSFTTAGRLGKWFFALLFVAEITDTQLVWWYIPIAILFSHTPDVDTLPELFHRKKVAASSAFVSDHRTFLHYPIISLPFGIVSGFLFGFWGWVWCVALILHLLNDLYGTGWGLPLLWPVSTRRYKVLGRRVNRLKYLLQQSGQYQRLPHNERKLCFAVSWSAKEPPEYIQKWGMEDWIEKIYMRLTWISGIEYLLFIGACVLVLRFFY